jgi:hypothetical protein
MRMGRCPALRPQDSSGFRDLRIVHVRTAHVFHNDREKIVVLDHRAHSWHAEHKFVNIQHIQQTTSHNRAETTPYSNYDTAIHACYLLLCSFHPQTGLVVVVVVVVVAVVAVVVVVVVVMVVVTLQSGLTTLVWTEGAGA